MSGEGGVYTVDRNATVLAYSRVKRGGVDAYDCDGCRNFRLARPQVFPEKFLQLLGQLGIDPLKDGEVYHVGRLSLGRHSYAGWYHFVGDLGVSGELSVIHFGGNFRAWMCRAFAPRLASLKDLPAVQLEFQAEGIPWLLDEPELT